MVKILDKTVNQEVRRDTKILCCTTLSNVEFSWTFVNSSQANISQPSVIQKAENCDGKVGPYQLTQSPDFVIVCNFKFPQHHGRYRCRVKNDAMNVDASKSMLLNILGKNGQSFLIWSSVNTCDSTF